MDLRPPEVPGLNAREQENNGLHALGQQGQPSRGAMVPGGVQPPQLSEWPARRPRAQTMQLHVGPGTLTGRVSVDAGRLPGDNAIDQGLHLYRRDTEVITS